jgi:hypothetical protein
MIHTEADLALARRHVREADARIARQRTLLGKLSAGGHPTRLASELLRLMEETAEAMRAHLLLIEQETAPPP